MLSPVKTKQQEIREGLAREILECTTGGHFYPIDEIARKLLEYLASQEVVLKVEKGLPYECICGGYDWTPKVEKYSGGKVAHCYECDSYNTGLQRGFGSATEPLK